MTNFKMTCRANNSLQQVTKVQDTSVTVTAPTQVAPGETFTYRIQNGPSAYPNSESIATTTNITRLKFDFMIPENATFVSAAVVGSGINIDGVAPNVLRVDESGTPSATGQILRLSGNNQVVGNSPTSSTNSEGGIRAPKLKLNLDGTPNSAGDSWFQLPAVDVTVVAGAVGTPIEPKIRTGGNAANFNAFENFNTTLPRASALGTQWANTRCSPRDSQNAALNAGAGALATINVTESQLVSTTTALSAPATAEAGTPVTLTATVEPAGATGSVQFQADGVDIGSPVTVSGGTATLEHTFTSAGARSITAVFAGTGNFTGSASAAQTVTVSDPVPVDIETALALVVPQGAETGTAVDLTANVTPATAEGTVQFQADGVDIGSPVTVSNGVASLQYTFSTAGVRAIGVTFTGDAGFAGSAAQTQNVTVTDPDVATTISLAVPQNAETGALVDLTANITPQNAVGSVQFQDNGIDIGSPVTVSNGVATLQHTFADAGSHSITATFSGGAGFSGSSASAQNINVSDPAPVDVETALALQVPATAETGEAANLVATVTPSDAQGTVQFKVDGVAVGAPVAVAGGTAAYAHTFATAGPFEVTADFIGSTGFTNSTAGAQTVTVSDPTPVEVNTTTILSVPGNAKTGEPEDLIATVYDNTSSEVVSSIGTVEFFDNGVSIGTAPVVDGLATLPHTFTTAGTHTITAMFSGATGFAGSTADAKQVVVTVPTVADIETTTVVTLPASATVGTAVQISAQVTGADNATVNGTVQFFDGENPIGDAVPVVDGVAVLNHIFTTTGAHSIRAEFSGAQGVADSASSVQTLQVSGGSSGGLGSLSAILEALNFGS